MPQIQDPADLVKTVSEFLQTLQGYLPTSEPRHLPQAPAARELPNRAPEELHKLAVALHKIAVRVQRHAAHINTLHDDEATTRNMVIGCENLVAQAEARLLARIEAAEHRLNAHQTMFAVQNPAPESTSEDVNPVPNNFSRLIIG